MELTMAQFTFIIRKRIKMHPDKAIFMFVKDTVHPSHTSIAELYRRFKDEDGFLYMTYSEESVFGSGDRASTL
jgi:GABA(A) receptor-associated protein